MKIKCDSCGAKYQIADDKVKHRIFKIRCKRCENVIVVHAEEGADDPTVAVSAMNDQAVVEDPEATKQVHHDEATTKAGQPESGEDDAVWHVVVNREQIGPVTPQDVAGYLGRGEITGEAFVWREGMGDWSKLSTLDNFAHLFSNQSDDVAEPEVGNPFAGEAAGNPFSAGEPEVAESSHFDEQADDDVMMSDGADAQDSPGIFAQVDAQAGPIDEFGAEAGGQLAGQRNDNSVLFSLDDLENQNSRSGGGSNTGGRDGSGLIDISVLGGGSGQPEGTANPGTVPSEPVGIPSAMPSLVSRKRSNVGLIVGLAAAGVVLAVGIGFAVYMAMSSDDTKTPTVTSTDKQPPQPKKLTVGGTAPIKTKPAAGEAAAVTKTPTADAGSPEVADKPEPPVATEEDAKKKPEVVAVSKKRKRSKAKRKRRRSSDRSRSRTSERKSGRSDGLAASTARPKTVTKPKPKPKPKRRSGKKDELDDLLSGVGGTGAKRPKPRPKPSVASPKPAPSTNDNPLLPEKLSRRQVLSVVRRNARSIADCKRENPDLTGTVMVDITIAGSGRVQRAKVATSKFSGTRVGRCVEGRVKSFRFPRFGGAVMKLKIPFGIR